MSNSSDVFLSRDEEEEHAPELCVVYENKALEMESPEEAKTTNL